jgi:multicomponent Na+:H+ antiporter subunit F
VSRFLLALVPLVLTYAFVLASFDPWDLGTGAVVGAALLWGTRRFTFGESISPVADWPRRAFWFVPFAAVTVWEMTKGTWNVALVVLHLRPLAHPGLVALPFEERTRLGVTIWALAITIRRVRSRSTLTGTSASCSSTSSMRPIRTRSGRTSCVSTGDINAGSFRSAWEGAMHQAVFYAAAAWMTVLVAVSVVFIVRARSTMVRILGLDVLTLLLVAFLILYADSNRSPYYLDAALALALLSFVSTLAAARYHSERRLFS